MLCFAIFSEEIQATTGRSPDLCIQKRRNHAKGIVAAGTLEEIALAKESVTGKYL